MTEDPATSDSKAHTTAEALRRWMEARFGGPVTAVGTPVANTTGLDSAIYFVRYRGDELPAAWTAPLVLRVKPSVDGLALAQREADVQNWLAERDFPAPRVLALLEPGEIGPKPAQVMERAPGHDAATTMKHAPWSARRVLRRLAATQTDLHTLDPTGFPATGDLLDRRLSLVEKLGAELDDARLAAGIERVGALESRLRASPEVVCHGDYHPMNAVVDGTTTMIVDWSDAGTGDRHGDLARTLLLFEMSWIAASGRAERRALRAIGPAMARSYRRCLRQLAPFDDERIALWTPVHLLHGFAQALGAAAGAFDDREVDLDSRLGPSLAEELARRFDDACRAVEQG